MGESDPRWGEVPVGFVVLADGLDIDDAELIEFGRRRLASFKIPKKWVRTQAMPMTTSGKIRRINYETSWRSTDLRTHLEFKNA